MNAMESTESDQLDNEEPLELEQGQESETPPEEATNDQEDSDQDKDEQAPTDGETQDDELVISFGDEPEPQQKAPDWVKELRKSWKETKQENRELRQKLESLAPKRETITLGPKPKLESFDYDSEKYETALSQWYETKRLKEAEEQEQKTQLEQKQKQWQDTLENYEAKKAELKVKDFDEAEEVIAETFNQAQQAIVVKGAQNPALLFYALGKNPAKAKALAQENDPVKFAFAVSKLEKDLKVKNTRKPPPPESTPRSKGGSTSGAIDSTLERLRKEAERTGNYTKVIKYKKSKKV